MGDHRSKILHVMGILILSASLFASEAWSGTDSEGFLLDRAAPIVTMRVIPEDQGRGRTVAAEAEASLGLIEKHPSARVWAGILAILGKEIDVKAVEELTEEGIRKSKITVTADLLPLMGLGKLTGFSLQFGLPFPLGDDPKKVQFSMGCKGRVESFRNDMTDEYTWRWLLSDNFTRWPPWIAGGLTVTETERLVWKLSGRDCSPVIVDRRGADWIDLSVIPSRGLTMRVLDAETPFSLVADAENKTLSFWSYPRAALPIRISGDNDFFRDGILQRSVVVTRHRGHRPVVRGRSVMDAPDKAREFVARALGKRLHYASMRLGLPGGKKATLEDDIRSMRKSMVPLRNILESLATWELRGVAKKLGIPGPRKDEQRSEAIDDMMERFQKME